jgi:hypothetical protein
LVVYWSLVSSSSLFYKTISVYLKGFSCFCLISFSVSKIYLEYLLDLRHCLCVSVLVCWIKKESPRDNPHNPAYRQNSNFFCGRVLQYTELFHKSKGHFNVNDRKLSYDCCFARRLEFKLMRIEQFFIILVVVSLL